MAGGVQVSGAAQAAGAVGIDITYYMVSGAAGAAQYDGAAWTDIDLK